MIHRIWCVIVFTGLLALGTSVGVQAQEFATISGFVRDSTSGETLLQANVILLDTQKGAATNNAGFYTIASLQPGTYTVFATYIGYHEFRTSITLRAGEKRRLDIDLVPTAVEVQEVVVSARREEDREARRIGVTQMKTQSIKQLPAVFEPDVFRSLQLLPGVKAASDYSSGLYIRGGGPDQTLILLDRNTVYNPSHFFGFFSTFNPDAIKDVRLYKGGYPAEYGGRLGSVVDIYNKDGNRNEMRGGLSVGLLASRAYIEGPYSRGSYMLAVRRSTIDPLLSAMRSAGTDDLPDMFYFYDVNGKVNFDASANDKISTAFYAGTDRLDYQFLEDSGVDIRVGNQTVSANWMHLFSNNLFSNFTLTNSHYFSEPLFRFAGTEFERDNNVYDVSAKGELEYIPNDRHSLKTGAWFGNFVMRLEDSFDRQQTLGERIQTVYGSLYVQDTYKPTSLWQVQGGLRANFFKEGDYLRLEPRLSVEYQPTSAVRFQAGYGRYYQFLALISSEVFSAFDVWLTTDDGVSPSYGDQFVGGVKTVLGNDVRLDVEGYYRTMENLFEFDPFIMDAAGVDYPDLFRYGRGYAYGTEILLEKTRGRVNGFIGYTLGTTRRRFPNVNDEEYYAPKYDRTHDLHVVMNYRLGRKWRVSSVFTYTTGQAYTEPSGQWHMYDNPFSSNDPNGLISRYNAARMPNYHRLDIGFTKLGRFFGFADYELQLQMINVYNRRNIWFYYYEYKDDNGENRYERKEVPQIPVPIPNVSLTLSF